METSILGEEVRKGVSFRKNYEQYLDNILNQLQTLSDVERRRIEDHIGKLLPASILGANLPLSEQTEEIVKGTFPVAEQAALSQQADDRVTKMLQVDVEGEPLAFPRIWATVGFLSAPPTPWTWERSFF